MNHYEVQKNNMKHKSFIMTHNVNILASKYSQINYLINHYEAQTCNMKHNTTSMTHNEICYAFYETQSHYYDSQGRIL